MLQPAQVAQGSDAFGLRLLRMLARDQSAGNLLLPRFRLEYGADLVVPLAQLGLLTGTSDFGDMGAGPLVISHVIHKAWLEVDEEGTTAAAATAVFVRKALMESPFEMVVDRPFLCAIVDRESRATLFFALVAVPE